MLELALESRQPRFPSVFGPNTFAATRKKSSLRGLAGNLNLEHILISGRIRKVSFCVVWGFLLFDFFFLKSMKKGQLWGSSNTVTPPSVEVVQQHREKVDRSLFLMDHEFNHERVVRPKTIAQLVKNLPAMQETPVWSLGWEDLLEKV